MQWLKLHDRNPLYTTLVDKYAVKSFVKQRIGSQYVTPLFARWERPEDIDISELPNKFVLKTNCDSGGIVLCRDKESFDLDSTRLKLDASLNRNYYWRLREWPYKNVRPCVFAEELIDAPEGEITDYKFFCFNGEPLFLYVSTGMESHKTARVAFLHLDWTRAPFYRNDYQQFEDLPPKPKSFDEMLNLARVLSAGIPFVRIDLFEANGYPRFSEVTFTTAGGFLIFEPVEWDFRLGEMIDLSKAYESGKDSGVAE